MSFFSSLDPALSGPVARALGQALLHFLWQGAVVAALTAAAWSLLRRRSASARYAVGMAALACMAALPLLTAAGELAADRGPVGTAAAMARQGAGLRHPGQGGSSAVGGWEPARSVALVAASWLDHHTRTVLLLWLSGVGLLTLRLVGGWRLSRVRVAASLAVPERWRARLDGLAARIRLTRGVRLVCSAGPEGPFQLGCLRPVSVVPAVLLTGMSPQQLDAILLHELAHIRRHDYLLNLLQTAVETLLFYHPAVWWVSRRVRREREDACDDLALAPAGGAMVYARALLALELRRSGTPPLALAADGSGLIRRIRRLVAPPVVAGPPRGVAGGLLLVAAVPRRRGVPGWRWWGIRWAGWHRSSWCRPVTEVSSTEWPSCWTGSRTSSA